MPANCGNIADVLARYDGLLAVHLRSEGDRLLESLQEMLDLAEGTGIRLQVSHLKANGPRNWHKAPDLLRQLERAAARGVRVAFDQYPYDSGSTALSSLLPPWMHQEGVERMREMLLREEVREQVRADLATGLPSWESHVAMLGWDGITVMGLPAEHHAWEGRRIGDLARETGRDPLELTCGILADPRGTPGMILHSQDEEVVRRILVHPLGTLGTDGLNDTRPHPVLRARSPASWGDTCGSRACSRGRPPSIA